MNVNTIFNESILRHSKFIKYVISTYFTNSMDQDDVLQEVLIHILNQLKKSSREELSKWDSEGWIKVVVRNKCISILRSQQRDNKLEKSIVDDSHLEKEIHGSSFHEDSVLEFDQNNKVIKIRELFNVLNDRDRKLIILRFFKNYSIKEIDELLSVKNSAVYILRAIDRLKKELGVDQFFNYFDGFDIEIDEDLV